MYPRRTTEVAPRLDCHANVSSVVTDCVAVVGSATWYFSIIPKLCPFFGEARMVVDAAPQAICVRAP
jgi:hypothetical protein